MDKRRNSWIEMKTTK